MSPPRHPFPYPAPGTLGPAEAVKWYLESVRAIPGALKRDRSPAEMLEEAWQIKSRLRLAAALALVEQELAEEFLRKMPLPSIDALLAGAWDEEAERRALVKIVSITVGEKNAFPATIGESIGLEVWDGEQSHVMTETGWQPKEDGGFPPGNPVKTPDGYKRIEDVQVGDIVLSAHPDGTAPPQPKRVVRTFRREGRTLINTSTAHPDESNRYTPLNAAGATRFWVEDRGWVRLDAIEGEARLRTLDGPLNLMRRYPVYRTLRPGIGWVQAMHNTEESYGTLFDYAGGGPVAQEGSTYLEQEVWDSDERFLRATVHDLDVEDFHTYYVSGHWVRCP
ncbi:MAG TPA: hypothetical protein VFK48_00225 [Usitatibacter sp.]|nr:hypothetical protein [Usitatibacter sp.]